MTSKPTSTLPKLAATLDAFLCLLLVLLALSFLFMIGATSYHLISGEAPALNGYEIRLLTSLPPLTATTASGDPVQIKIESATARIPLEHASVALQLISLAGVTSFLGITASAIIVLRRFLRSLKTSHPFVSANAQRLRTLAWLTLVGGLVYTGFSILAGFAVQQNFSDLNLRITLSGTSNALFFALILFIIAEVFKIGVQMREEQELTV